MDRLAGPLVAASTNDGDATISGMAMTAPHKQRADKTVRTRQIPPTRPHKQPRTYQTKIMLSIPPQRLCTNDLTASYTRLKSSTRVIIDGPK